MGTLIDGVKTVNSTVRTAALAGLVIVLGLTAWVTYSEVTKRERLLFEQRDQIALAKEQLAGLQSDLKLKDIEIEELGVEIQEQAAQIERLETAMHLLKTDQRLARLEVLDIERDNDGRAIQTKLRFTELSPQGDPLNEGKTMELPGDLIYIDNWVVKFDDEFIEKADLERGTSLCLFRRIFSEQQMPTEGVSLDEVGMRPQAYARGGMMSEFEQQLWDDFWEFANDASKAAEMGIRAANGEAVSIKVREGRSYNVSLRSSGGLSIEPTKSQPE